MGRACLSLSIWAISSPKRARIRAGAIGNAPDFMKGCIFRYSKYKAWNAGGIITARVNPRNTSRECHRCHAPVIRYNEGEPVEGYTPGASLCLCPQCQMRDHADRNASLRIGQRLLERDLEPVKEKPHARSRRAKREPKGSGVGISKACRTPKGTIYPPGKARRSCQRAWHRPEGIAPDGCAPL